MTRGGDRGYATVVALGIVALLLVAGIGVTAVAEAVLVHDRAAVAADAAALAGASTGSDGTARGCADAALLAARNGAVLVGCTVVGAVVTVRARAAPPAWLAWAGAATVKARAGPADNMEEGSNPDEPARVDPPS